MKILVGTPTYNGQVTGQYTRSMLELQGMLGPPWAGNPPRR